MTYEYKPDDMFYDVESLANVYTVAWWVPKQNAVILSYLDDDGIIKNEQDQDMIRNYIYQLHPKLKENKTLIVFEDIGQTGCINEFVGLNGNTHSVLGMQSFAKRLGLTNEKTYINARTDERGLEGGGLKYHPAFYPVKQTDPDYNENLHGYRFGYNSLQYDTTIMAKCIGDLHDIHFTPSYTNRPVTTGNGERFTAASMRTFNDELFESEWRSSMHMRLANNPNDYNAGGFGNFKSPTWIIRKGWILTGRFIDVARLNEKLQKVGLKRLLGMLGLQIMESEKLENNTRINNLEEFADLLAYNISDVVNLQHLFEHKVYQNSFNVRGQLLKTFPATVYAQKREKPSDGRERQVDAGNYTNIRRDRLTRDSTSAKFVEYAIAPYSPIKDIPVVSFLYPSEQEAKKRGVPQVDILEETKKYFEENVTNDPSDQAHKDFMQVYAFYDSIRGKNFNSSDAYKEHYGANAVPAKTNEYVKELMKTYNTNLFYHHKDENGNVYRSSCLANFSIGGIHGAEINVNRFKEDVETYQSEKTLQEYIESIYPSAVDALNGESHIVIPDHITVPKRLEGKIKEDRSIKIREFVKSGSTKKKADWKSISDVELFKKSTSGKWEVQDKYKYVSSGPSHHEDFVSYYPLLLSLLSVFSNPSYHGYEDDGSPKDPYFELFLTRLAKKKESKDMSLSAEQRESANIEQESRKLLINAASGAGDATFDNNIRANNAVISMRIIGQLFAWRIGQAQSLAGARVPSTNTDGLYTMDISAEDNDRILQEVSKDMLIGIEPERLDRFVSKDSNNRLEVFDGRITSAKGGTLNSWGGPQPTQNLDHAAVIDHILAKYLADERFDNPANIPFDKEYARSMFDGFIKEYIEKGKPQEALKFFQWILASSSGTHRYTYAKFINKHTGEVKVKNLQHYNRIFLLKDDDNEPVRQEVRLATRKKINKNTWDKRMASYQNGELSRSDLWEHDKDALQILVENGLDLLAIQANSNGGDGEYERDEAQTQKIRAMPEDQHIAVFNNSIVDLPNDQAIQMISMLDIDAYVGILEKTFLSWSNLKAQSAS